MARRAFTGVEGTDLINTFPATLDTLLGDLDPTVFYDQGPIGSRPTATPGSPSQQVGDLYLVTGGPVPILWRNAGTRWVPMTQIGFSAVPSTAQSIPYNAWTKVTLGTEEWDDAGWFASSRFVPLVAGVYAFTLGVGLANTLDSGDRFAVALYKNGTRAVYHTLSQDLNDTSPLTVQMSRSQAANGASDYFEMWCFHEHSAGTPRSTDVSLTFFEGKLIRPS